MNDNPEVNDVDRLNVFIMLMGMVFLIGGGVLFAGGAGFFIASGLNMIIFGVSALMTSGIRKAILETKR